MNSKRARVAVLGTLAEFHHGAVAFDLQSLVNLVVQVQPDLLCLDIAPEQWQLRQFDDLPPEYRHALLPLAERSDIVVVPIGDSHSHASSEATGLRRVLTDWLRQRLAGLQRRAPSPEAINYGWRHDLANVVYFILDALDRGTDRVEKSTHIDELIENIKQVAQRDPVAEILVVVNVRYCHHIRPVLDRDPSIELVPFTKMRGRQ